MKKKLVFALALLGAVLGLGVTSQADSFLDKIGIGTEMTYGKYADEKSYQTGSFTYDGKGIEKVKLNWVGGAVTVVSKEEGELSVTEEEQESEDKKLHYRISGGELTIHFCKSKLKAKSWDKDLTLEIPKGVELEISQVSGSLDLGDESLKELELSLVSADLQGGLITTEEASIETVSGEVAVEELQTEKLDLESVSGDVSLGISQLKKGKIESVSGDIQITLKSGLGAKVKTEKIMHKSSETYGDGKATLDIETVSGDVKVEEK